MNDTWYVQKGVELLGWEVTDDAKECNGFWFMVELPMQPDAPADRKEVHSSWRWTHDVIAGRLVGQVDALRGPWLTFDRVSDGEYQANVFLAPDFAPCSVTGPNRTMNTIRAIVDSKVLEGE